MAGVRIESEGNAVDGTERFSAEVGPALLRALLKGALALGRRIAENVEDFKTTVGTRRLSRSFLVPEPDGVGNMILGGESPIYAAIHEYGGDIHPIHGEYLHWKDAGGDHFAKQVHIREKRYARSAIEEFDGSAEMTSILASEIHGAIS